MNNARIDILDSSNNQQPIKSMKKVILSLIKAYQRSWLIRSPLLKTLFLSDQACRFTPTCSQYAYQAIGRYGIMRGSWIALRRIVRCHPWSKGGKDPIK